jgi:hypothetical protein
MDKRTLIPAHLLLATLHRNAHQRHATQKTHRQANAKMVKKRRGTFKKRSNTQMKKAKKSQHFMDRSQRNVTFGNETIRKNWDDKSTLLQNYRRLGLSADVNGVIDNKGNKDNKPAKAGKRGVLSDHLTAMQQRGEQSRGYVPKSMSIDEQRLLGKLIERYATAKGHKKLTEPLSDDDDDDDDDNVDINGEPKIREYPDAVYKDMARDTKINVHQQTTSQLRKRIALLTRLQMY